MLSFKNRIKRLLVLYIILSVLMPIGCNQATRYKILTFFFEGVPPPGSRERAAAIAKKKAQEDSSDDPVAKDKPVRVARQTDSSRHAPIKYCNKCHRGTMRKRKRQLIKPVPDLCYSCHKQDYTRSVYVHAPVRIGDCLECHTHHQSGFIHLQKAAQPALCYQCHLQQDMNTIPGHQESQDVICTKCHNPHSSSEKKLLRSPKKSRVDSNDVEFE